MISVDTLALEEKIGQMLCLGWQSDDSSVNDAFLNVNEQARRCVEELHAGGMILFARNVQAPGNPRPPVDTVQVRDMIAELQNLAKIPLFVAVDQEGGRVARFGAPFTAFPSAKVFGEANQWELAQKAAKCTAKELRAVGVNFNFAPVADINSNPANPVIGDRAFGDNVRVVTTMVISQLPGFYTGGVLSCVKHFPGHGDTDLDSHLALPMLTHSRKKMDKRELQPFKSAIELRVPAIMTAHILFPALDDTGVPATLSKPILTDLLRGELGFRGLIVTDCLQMKAVADTWGTARAAVMAAKAGADILLVCHTWERQKETFDALLAAVRSGELSEAQVNDSVRRILGAKANLPTGDGPPLSVIGSPAHVSVARQVCEAAGVPFQEPVVAPTLGESAL